jgi:acetoacetyl-CoA synthetase
MTVSSVPLWTPTPERIERAAMTAFARRIGASNYEELHRFSLEQPAIFWAHIWDSLGIKGERGERVLEMHTEMPRTRFFPDARLNVAENLLARIGPEPAIIARNEAGNRRELSWDELRLQVLHVAGALRAAGMKPGDRVAVWLPLVPEAVIVLIAATMLGAVYSSTSPDFGVDGVVDRFGQIEPTVLVAAKYYEYGGKSFDCLERLRDIQSRLPSLSQTVVLGAKNTDLDGFERTMTWNDWLGVHQPLEPHFERFGFDHPWYVLFSSGTTGKPKCIVHRAGGVFLNLKKEHVLHCDIHGGDRVMYFTTTGWMMFNWLVNVLAVGASIVLYDGNPGFPSMNALWDVVDAEGVTLLGVGAKYLDSLRKSGLEPINTHRLETLRTICSTGSPLVPEGFAFVYQSIKHDLHLASISGGTDICGCFVGGNPTEPVYAGELQRPALGMASDVWDESGLSLRDQPGLRGELVCTQAFPSMPLGFWNDTDGMKYHSAYFARFPNVWAHGDFASWTEHGGMMIHGRSDTTLNPGGVRIGTAEIYRVVENIPGVLESLVFGQDWQSDVRVVLLVRLEPERSLTTELEMEIKAHIRAATTPRHVPAMILQVADLPRTRSNKLVELAVADAVNGRIVRNTEAIANPEALWEIARREELRS